MANSVALPEGFVLDEPEIPALPEGFVLDEPIDRVAADQKALAEEQELPGRIALGKGMTNIIRGVRRLINEIPGIGDEELAERLKQESLREEALFEPLREAHPISTFVGEVAGETAALPIGGVGKGIITRAVSSVPIGGAIEAAIESGKGSQGAEVLSTGIIGGVFGPFGEAAGFLISKFGTPAVNAIKRAIRKLTGKQVPGNAFDGNGNLTDAGQQLLDDLDVSDKELRDLLDEFGEQLDPNLDTAAAIRKARSDIDLTRGQLEQDPNIQTAERNVRESGTPQGGIAQEIQKIQDQQVAESVEAFKTKIGARPDVSRGDRDIVVRGALQEQEDIAETAVTRLYKDLEDIEGGEQAIADITLGDETIRTLLIRRKAELVREFATTEAGATKKLDEIFEDFELIPTKTKSALHQGELSFKNAEKMRQRINSIKTTDKGDLAVLVGFKKDFDDAFIHAVESVPENEAIQTAAGIARKASRDKFKTFNAKDIIQELNAFKVGTVTDRVSDELVLQKILATGRRKIDNIKRVKAVLTGKTANNRSRDAFESIQTQAILDIFEGAIDSTGKISGAKLNGAVDKFGSEALDELFSPTQIKALRRLQQSVGDATIDLLGVTERKGSKVKDAVAALFGAGTALKYGFVVRSAASQTFKAIEDAAEAKEFRDFVLEGIKTGSSPEQKVNSLLRLLGSVGTQRTTTAAVEDADIPVISPVLNP